jgi:hypothetical protein
MATKGVNPFAKFEKSPADKDTPAVTRKFGKEGSAKEEAFDKKQGGFPRKFAEGGFVGAAPSVPGGPDMGRNMPRPPGGGVQAPPMDRGAPMKPPIMQAPPPMDRGMPQKTPDQVLAPQAPLPVDRGMPPPAMDRGMPQKTYAKGGMVRRGWGKARGA